MADYCNVGGFKCKYCYKGVCDFFCMGSGNTEDMPCISNPGSDDGETEEE